MAVLPERPDLERLRRVAKALQRACLTGEPAAISRVAARLPDADPRRLALAKAQSVVARDYGFASWPAMKAAVEALRTSAKPKTAADVDAERLAAEWFTLAEAPDLRPLLRSIQVGKGRLEAAREVMRRDRRRFRAFQEALVASLQAPREKVRFMCAHALDIFGAAWTRPSLIAAMEDPVPRVRWMAMHALSCHAGGDKPVLEAHVRDRILTAVTGDPSRKVRFHATHALAGVHDRASKRVVVPVLLEIRANETDPKLRDAARWVLWQLTKDPDAPKSPPGAKPSPAAV
jgi:hypothetical protein